mgnify:CR=1 FL=1
MIITVSKPVDELLTMLQPFNRVFIVGCGECATVCQTGGEEQVKRMANELSKLKEVVGVTVIESPCDERLVRRDLKNTAEMNNIDAFLVMSCGIGVQTISEATGAICIPALDTKFMGKVEKIGRFYERCRACGECILYETGGICPITRCAKGLLNGPCGGQANGKCEVGNWQNDCAWVLIHQRLKEIGQLNRFKKFREPRDYQLKAGPGEVIWR